MELLSYMVNMFAIMFWLFRVYVALMVSSGSEIQFTTPGLELEITVIFITLISIFMIFKRNLIFLFLFCNFCGIIILHSLHMELH